MKKYIFLFFFFIGFAAQAQFGNMNRRQRQMPQTQREAPEPNFKIKKYLGIIIYDIKKAAKKSSVNLSSNVGKEFTTKLTAYNKEINDITRINSFLLKSTKQLVENFQKKAMKSGNFSNQPKVMKKMNENLKPISETLKKEDKKLITSLKELLSEKQFTKWLKYNKKLNKIFPEIK